ncbi:hypothetical protein F5882DRAFT_471017 [Hyaloscypha sp. PMI_1271]|nr:hypothetical protein F5882DRAFT_471017 [Hyaloscypha sp. PMI_1271]
MTKALANLGVRPGTLSALILVRVDAALEGMHSSGQWVPPAEIRERNGTYEVSEMALIRVLIKNHSGQSLGYVVLNCAVELSIEQLFPSHMPYYILHENETTEVIVYMTVAPELRASAESVTYVDTLKIFACNPLKGLESL